MDRVSELKEILGQNLSTNKRSSSQTSEFAMPGKVHFFKVINKKFWFVVTSVVNSGRNYFGIFLQ
jgi:hypothetical protein